MATFYQLPICLFVLIVAINGFTTPECQKWCYRYTFPNKITFGCCNSTVKDGYCPDNCIFEKNCFDLSPLYCNADKHCPENYKCCDDKCYTFHKICKPIVLTQSEVPENATELPPAQKTINPNGDKTTIEDFDVVTTSIGVPEPLTEENDDKSTTPTESTATESTPTESTPTESTPTESTPTDITEFYDESTEGTTLTEVPEPE